MVLQQIYNYLLYLCSGVLILGTFTALYVHMTPISEFRLIREGCTAAALSLTGALLGFSLTVAASILHTNSIGMFALWSFFAAIIQLLAYFILSRLIPEASSEIEDNNIAIGALFGGAALIIGIINTACLS